MRSFNTHVAFVHLHGQIRENMHGGNSHIPPRSLRMGRTGETRAGCSVLGARGPDCQQCARDYYRYSPWERVATKGIGITSVSKGLNRKNM